MLGSLGLSSVDALFDGIPAALRLAGGLEMEPGQSEADVLASIEHLAIRNRPIGPELVCFAGGGAYDHDIPSVVRALAMRSEFVTAYTPYQPEVAQGVLQALFEYQTMVCRLTGMDVANASLYDGASACVEAVNLAVAASGSNRVWLSDGVHPHTRAVVKTFAAGTGHVLVPVPLVDGLTAWPETASQADGSQGHPGVVVVGYPNYLGCIEDIAAAADRAHAVGALLVVVADPVALGLLRSPGECGADVVVGEGQPFGIPLGFGGPYLGLFACRSAHVRRLPGRLVGATVDTENRPAYVTTLRTREQDIRRERASSNVCTNQTLMAIAFLVHLAWLGTDGLAELALRCAQGARYARDAILAIDGVGPLVSAPTFREFAVRLPVPPPLAIERMAAGGFLAGIALDDDTSGGNGPGLLVAVTEKRTRAEIDAYVAALTSVLS